MKNQRKRITSIIAFACTLAIGIMPVNAQQWKQNGVGWYLEMDDGSYACNEWKEIGGQYYWFDANGYMVTGFQTINGQMYYFNASGQMQTGWINVNDKWYYADASGALMTGLQTIGDATYYFDASGEMLTGWQITSMGWQYFDQSSGAMINDHETEKGTIKGIDVSKYQKDIDWAKVKASGISFAFVRIGHGNRTLDPYYVKNIDGANSVGISTGVYFYSTATNVCDSILDAQFVIDNLQGHNVSYPVAIDMEDASQTGLGKAEITKIAKAFCDEIAAAGYTPMVYCNEYWYKNYLDFSQLNGIERWIARYNYKYDTNITRNIWQTDSTTRINGITGNVDLDFGYTDYTQKVTPRQTSWSGYVKRTGIWVENGSGTWYAYLTGGYPHSGWESIDNQWYYFNADGYLQYGWIFSNGYWYCLGSSGAMVTGWICDCGSWYYMNGSGTMQTGWIQDCGSWYYLNGSGVMQTGWIFDGSNWYYLNPSGAMATSWICDRGSWYYLDGAGAMTTGWVCDGTGWYYLGGNGAMATGWIFDGSNWYFMNDSGVMATGWIQYNGNWYYMNGSGAMATGWIQDCGNWYYLNESGEWQ